MTATLDLLRPRLLALRNHWRRTDSPGRRRFAALGLLAVLFWVAVFVFSARVLAYFQSVPELGPVLAERLLGMILLTFFSVLLFSNVVTALSSYYLASDLPFLLATPTPYRRLHAARFVETLWDSSWMILMFGLPVFLAYGIVYRAGPLFYLATFAMLPPFVMIPCALGISITMLLVRTFPARSTRDVFLLLSVVAVAIVYTLLRFLQPERLLQPEAFRDFVDFLNAIQSPASPYLPSSWAAESLIPFFAARAGQDPLFHYMALLSTAAASVVVCSVIAEQTYAAGWSRAQEGRRARITRMPIWDRLFAHVPGVSAPARALILKDAKTFFRDTTQWSQLILLAALVVVYVYNFRILPRAGAYLAQFYLAQALAFLNLALAGFVVASIAVRFIFPSVSIEGRSFWILQSAPIRLRTLWWSKFWSGLVPLLVLGALLVILSNQALQVGPFMMAVSVASLALMTFGIAALGLCIGSCYPRFDVEHVAKIPSSFGGAVYMITAIAFIGANVVLEAWPLYRILLAGFLQRPLGVLEIAGIAASVLALLALNAGVFVAATRIGIRRLESIEV